MPIALSVANQVNTYPRVKPVYHVGKRLPPTLITGSTDRTLIITPL